MALETGKASEFLNVQRSSRASYCDASGVLRWAEPHELRIDHGHVAGAAALVESAATNLLRNPRMEGTTLGPLNTANEPTYWDFSRTTGLGLTEEIVGVGQDDGIDYIDIKYSGVTAVAGTLVCSCENAVSVPALPGQVMTISTFLRLLSGDISQATGRRLAIFEQRVGQGALNTGAIDFATDGRPLREQRKEFTFTVAHAETTHILPQPYRISFAAGASVDFTIRVGLPQVEVGPRATSPVAPPVGTTGQSSRAADVVSVPTSAFPFNEHEGGVFVECVHLTTPATGTAALAALDGIGTVRIRHGQVIGGADFYVNDGAAQVDTGSFAITLGESAKYGYGYKEDDFAFSQNGKPVFTDSAGQVPATLTNLVLASGNAAIRIKRLVYVPRRPSNVEIQESAA